MLAVEDLCDRVIWLKDGRIVEEGRPGTVVSNYLQESFSTDTEHFWEDQSTAPGTDDVRLHRARPENGSSADPITVRTPFVIELEYWSLRPNVHLSPSVALYNEQGVVVFTSGPAFDPAGRERDLPVGLYRHVCQVPGDLLNDGTYRVVLYVDKNERTILQQDDILVFDVRDATEVRHGWHGKWTGVVRPMLAWSTQFVHAGSPRAAGSESRRTSEVP